MLLAIGLQESRFEHRVQIGDGPAHGFWQFERAGGVRGVMRHPASRLFVQQLAAQRDVPFDELEIWTALAHDDVLAAGLARALLYTDPLPLPSIGNADGAWSCYVRNWRPGKPHRQTWDDLYGRARECAEEAQWT